MMHLVGATRRSGTDVTVSSALAIVRGVIVSAMGSAIEAIIASASASDDATEDDRCCLGLPFGLGKYDDRPDDDDDRRRAVVPPNAALIAASAFSSDSADERRLIHARMFRPVRQIYFCLS